MKKLILIIIALYSTLLSAQEQKLKTVLFEEFTSEGCTYCPLEYPVIERLSKAFEAQGVEVSVVAHHINDIFALPKSKQSEAYFALEGYPSTSINRKAPSWKNSLITDIQNINNSNDFVRNYIGANKDLAEFTKTSIMLRDDVLEVKLEGRIFADVNKCYLTAILTEDNVQGFAQKNYVNPSKSGRKYTHHKLARAYLTLGIGEKLSPKADGTFALELESYKLNDKWKKEDLRVVVFISKRLTNQDITERFVLTSKTLKLNKQETELTALTSLQKEATIVGANLGKIYVRGAYDRVEVYDLHGCLLARTLERVYPKGIYIVKLIQDGKAYTYKLSL